MAPTPHRNILPSTRLSSIISSLKNPYNPLAKPENLNKLSKRIYITVPNGSINPAYYIVPIVVVVLLLAALILIKMRNSKRAETHRTKHQAEFQRIQRQLQEEQVNNPSMQQQSPYPQMPPQQCYSQIPEQGNQPRAANSKPSEVYGTPVATRNTQEVNSRMQDSWKNHRPSLQVETDIYRPDAPPPEIVVPPKSRSRWE